MAQQTAVEYLIQEIKNDVFVHSKSTKEWNEIFKQAKAMEKEQIMNAWNERATPYPMKGMGYSVIDATGEQYYNETYNQK